jgi:hypothetical protein
MIPLNRVATVAARLRRQCMAPSLQGFDHIYADLLAGCRSSAATAPFAPASSDSALVRQLDRVADVVAAPALYAKLDVLADIEQFARKLPTDENCRALEQRTQWRRHDFASRRRRSGTGPTTVEPEGVS